jgi:F0F1-type ATP synthase delta subunit
MTLSRSIAKLVVQKNLKIDDLVDSLRTYNLLSLLPSIKEAVSKLLEENTQKDAIHIESPFEINQPALQKIKRIVGNDLAETEVVINKTILAGFKARHKGKLYDGSAERIIKQLTNS